MKKCQYCHKEINPKAKWTDTYLAKYFCSRACVEKHNERAKQERVQAKKEEARKNRFNPFYLIKEKWLTILLTFLAWCVPAFLLWGAVLPVNVIVVVSLVIAIAQAWCNLHMEYPPNISHLPGLYFFFLYSLHGTLLFLAKSGILPASLLGALEWLGQGTAYAPLFVLAVLLTAFRVVCNAKEMLQFDDKTKGILYWLAFAVCAFYLLSVFLAPVECAIGTIVALVAAIKILGEDWQEWLPLILGGASLLLHAFGG